MTTLDAINKTREYLDYLERHILNVNKAWAVIKDKCRDLSIISDDYRYFTLQHQIEWHDLTKISKCEFVQYRSKFFRMPAESDSDFKEAWEHHLKHNHHHWQNIEDATDGAPYAIEIACVHMVVDWMAMGYEFGNTAKSYYEENKDKIELPIWAVDLVYKIFSRVYEETR